MSKIIKSKLLGLILDKNVKKGSVVLKGKNLFYTSNKKRRKLNFDTFGRICKEWSIAKEYTLCSGLDMTKSLSVAFCEIHYRWETETLPVKEASSEVKAIIRAVKWIAKAESQMKTIKVKHKDIVK